MFKCSEALNYLVVFFQDKNISYNIKVPKNMEIFRHYRHYVKATSLIPKVPT